MTLEARKLQLIQKLTIVTDETTLTNLEAILSEENDDWALSPQQAEFLKESIAELDAGKGIPHKKVMQEMDEKFKV